MTTAPLPLSKHRILCHALSLLTLAAFGIGEANAEGPGKTNDFQGRRVLIMGIDGCRRDVMAQVIQSGKAPTLARISSEGHAFWNMEAGGQPIGRLNQPTISGPGWSTLLTGVFASKHSVLGNGEKFSAGNFKDHPHLFRYIRDAKPQAWLGSIVGDTWPEVNTILIAGSGEHLANDVTVVPHEIVTDSGKQRKLNDAKVTQEAIRCLQMQNPDVLFLHFLDVDHAGHQFGFSADTPQYLSTLEKLDQYMGEVIAAIEKRPQAKEESWLIIVSTDHGGLKKGHGGQSPEERSIFGFFRGPGFKPAEEREGRVFQSLVTPTVLDYLQVPIKAEWGLESAPLKVDDH
ncbi:alkaline phosphatase family protein [Brevifollis gellanilyticus]|uniref:Nucleotide pyrophosphatase n=1 Tax=Brevifollis gellanilyticus TaxID=748831 RepID=A0A512MCE3_9BACT|nr:alkaline phosphatase family protein [Brevifollis gellanilyticus]GEP44396.1 nucleotide pyrophosphatase [Brevifollis gellanilyticus]